MADGNTDLIEAEQGAVSPQEQDWGDLTFAQRMMTDTSIDMERVERVLQMELDADKRASHKAYNRAMSAAQAEMPNVVKNAENGQTHSRYAKLDAVDHAMKPVITKHGFSLSFFDLPASSPDKVRVGCIIAHAEGHEREVEAEVQLDTLGPRGNPVKTQVHGWGSSGTYVRRKLKMMIFDVAETDDNDGNQVPPNPPVEKITEDQENELHALLTDNGCDVAKFLAVGNIASLADIEAKNFAAARAMIEKVIAQKAAQS